MRLLCHVKLKYGLRFSPVNLSVSVIIRLSQGPKGSQGKIFFSLTPDNAQISSFNFRFSFFLSRLLHHDSSNQYLHPLHL